MTSESYVRYLQKTRGNEEFKKEIRQNREKRIKERFIKEVKNNIPTWPKCQDDWITYVQHLQYRLLEWKLRYESAISKVDDLTHALSDDYSDSTDYLDEIMKDLPRHKSASDDISNEFIQEEDEPAFKYFKPSEGL